MTKIKIATWNINSVRLRVELVKKLLLEQQIDILGLQETKTQDEFFPAQHFADIGYKYLHFRGQKSYNGVAIISRIPFEKIENITLYNDDSRHVGVRIGDLNLHNFYVPSGGEEPDISINPKFDHKLNYLDQMRDWFLNGQHGKKLILMGDLNIAPLYHDVWSHRALMNEVSHTQIEIDKLTSLRIDNNFVDIARKFVPETEKLYSWWSYRNKDWKKSNRGRRLDHIWTSTNIENDVTSFEILKETRDWISTSDHVPVVAEILVR